MGIAIEKLFAKLLFWLYDFIDAVFECFQILCGLNDVELSDGTSASLIEVFLEHETVTQVFLCILLVAVGVAALCTAASIVKSIINMRGGERKSHAKSVGQGFGALFITLAMAVILITFIGVSNQALATIQKSFNSDYDNMTFSSMLFDLSVEGTYVYDYDNGEVSYVYVYDENGDPVYKPEYDDYGNIVYNENGSIKYSDEQETEIEYDSDGNIVWNYPYLKNADGTYVRTGYVEHTDACARDEDGELISETHGAACIDFSTVTVDQVFGVHKKTLGLLENSSDKYTTDPMVYLDAFNFFTAYLVVIIMIVVIIWTMLGLVRRIFDIVFLFLTMPLITATIPLDDGARFKTWRDTVTSKILLAWGAVFAVNIFLLFIPIITQGIDFTKTFDSTTIATVFKIFLILGCALSITSGQVLVARLMGTDASESREMAHGARMLLGGAVAGGRIIGSVRNNIGTRLFGGRNKNGKEYTGFFPQAARDADKGLQEAFGDRYINSGFATALHKIGRINPGVLNALRAESYGRQYGGSGNSNNIPGGGNTALNQPSGGSSVAAAMPGNSVTQQTIQQSINGGAAQRPESSTASDLAKKTMSAPKDNSGGAFRGGNNGGNNKK